MADLRVQKTIEVCLKHHYPTLNVQGEESKESMENISTSVDPLKITAEVKSMITTEFLNKSHISRANFIKNSLLKTFMPEEVSEDVFETFNTKDAVVWIDPLDGTSDFVKGNLPACTVLIGLSINGYSRFGIVHNPFSFEDQA